MLTSRGLRGLTPRRQRGAVTLFSAILILFLMTVAILYSSRNTLFDQRSAANEERTRKAFAAAEGATSVLQEFLVAETQTVISSTGWLDTTNGNWTVCPSSGAPDICTIDLNTTVEGFYIPNVGAVETSIQDAINDLVAEQPDVTARVAVALQFVDAGTAVGGGAGGSRQAVFMMYGYGYSDCATQNDLSTCQGEARVAVPLATFNSLANPPDVPFTSKSFVDSQGGWTVVANPNAGGVGVPVSMWLNGGATDSNDQGIDFDPGAGTWQTCEFDEWYETDLIPDYAACPGSLDANGDRLAGNHGCSCSADEVLSGSVSGRTAANLDLLVDPLFPPDLFLTYFGIAKDNYQIIKDSAQIRTDCTGLNADSEGLFWITGRCDVQSQIGHYDNPVVLVGAGGFDINGGYVFGVVFCTDVEDPANPPDIRLRGNGVVYGAIVVDCNLSGSNGTFDLVYNEQIIGDANGIAGVGAANGGWRDFDVPAYTGN